MLKRRCSILAAIFAVLMLPGSWFLAPDSWAQMPGAAATRVPPTMGGTGATTGAALVFAAPGGTATPVNCNQTGDTPVTIVAATANYRIDDIFVIAESGSFTNARIGLYTAAGQGGNALVGQTALSALTTTAANAPGSLTMLTAPAANMTQRILYFNIGTAQGGACTLNVYLGILPLANG
jgi:hypothetical protein